MVGAINRVGFDYSPIERVGAIDSISSGNDFRVSIFDFQSAASNVGSTASLPGPTGDENFDSDYDFGYDPYANEGSGNTPIQFA